MKRSSVLRGATWPKQARMIYAVVAVVVVVPANVAQGKYLAVVPGTLAVFAVIFLFCDWRVRRMGLRITEDGLEAVRFVDTVRLRWDEIAGFFTRPAGLGLWGDHSIRVHRQTLLGRKVPSGFGMKLPTLMIVGQGNPVGRWLGPCDLEGPDRRIPQPDVMDYLTTELRNHQSQPTPHLP